MYYINLWEVKIVEELITTVGKRVLTGMFVSTGIWVTSAIIEKFGRYDISEPLDKIGFIPMTTSVIVGVAQIGLEILKSE